MAASHVLTGGYGISGGLAGESGLVLSLGYGLGAVAAAPYSEVIFTINRRYPNTQMISRKHAQTQSIERQHATTVEVTSE